MFKKSISSILAIVMVIGMGTNVFAETKTSESNPDTALVQEAYEAAIEALSDYNHAVYQYEEADLLQYLENGELLNYLNKKLVLYS